jgi:hypothetical protein
MADLTLLAPAQEPIHKWNVSIFWAYLVRGHLLVWPSYGDNTVLVLDMIESFPPLGKYKYDT